MSWKQCHPWKHKGVCCLFLHQPAVELILTCPRHHQNSHLGWEHCSGSHLLQMAEENIKTWVEIFHFPLNFPLQALCSEDQLHLGKAKEGKERPWEHQEPGQSYGTVRGNVLEPQVSNTEIFYVRKNYYCACSHESWRESGCFISSLLFFNPCT